MRAAPEKKGGVLMAIKAWHFAASDRKLGYGDGRLIVKGRTLKYTGKEPIELCKRGLHGSERILDALYYAPGEIICRVELSGDIIRGTDKIVATERTCLWWLDATSLLWGMACWSAEQSLKFWEKQYPNDKRPHQAIAARRAWMAGSISDHDLAAARAAAGDAAWAAAGDAAWAAARDAQERKFTTLVMAAHRKQK